MIWARPNGEGIPLDLIGGSSVYNLFGDKVFEVRFASNKNFNQMVYKAIMTTKSLNDRVGGLNAMVELHQT